MVLEEAADFVHVVKFLLFLALCLPPSVELHLPLNDGIVKLGVLPLHSFVIIFARLIVVGAHFFCSASLPNASVRSASFCIARRWASSRISSARSFASCASISLSA